MLSFGLRNTFKLTILFTNFCKVSVNPKPLELFKQCDSLSAYEVKNNCCLFERPFKVKNNGVFLFGISFFVLEIFTFL